MSRPVRIVLLVVAMVLISAPLSIVVTLLLIPFWSWFESTTGIESIGHSGPAEWCYAVVFVVLVTAGSAVLLGKRRGKTAGGDSTPPPK